MDKVWARQILVHETEPAALTALFGPEDADQLITGTALRTPQMRVARDGEVLPQSSYTRGAAIGNVPLTGLVDAKKLLALFDDGATVVFQGLHRYWRPLTELVRELDSSLGHPCQANAYLTPPGSQGFALHSDSHDVFVLQTHGVKQWEVHDDSGARSVLMEPGTSMYLPTGTRHAAYTHQGASLHVTIGINRVTWRDLVSATIEPLLGDPAFTEPLPAGHHADTDSIVEGLRERLTVLSHRLAEVEAADSVASHAARFLSTRQAALHGGLLDRLELDRLGDVTLVRRRRASTLALMPTGGGLRVLLGDRELRVPAHLEPALRHLQRHLEIRPCDLEPWLDAQSRLVLVRRLVREGLLEVVR